MLELLDTADLHIETNDNGFVLGKSLFGTKLGSSGNSWREVKGDFSQMTLNRPLGIDKAVLFRPEAPVLSLRTVIEDYYEGVFGKTIRVRWKDEIQFVGTIKSATIASQAMRDGKDTTTVNVSAVGIIDFINSYRLYNLIAPEQTVADRIASITPPSVTITVAGGNRLMAAKGQSSPTLMEALQDAADVAQARFYVNKHDQLIIDATNAPDPVILFSDDVVDTDRILYRNINTQENATNTITGLVVTAKSDQAQTKTSAVAEYPNPSLTNEQAYEVDVPVNAGALEAWAESFPLQGKAVQSPTNIDCYWQEALADLDLTHQVDVKWKGNGYRCGIKGITHTMQAERGGKFRWNVKYELFPGHLLGFNRLNSPTKPSAFVTGGVYNAAVAGTYPDRVAMLWEPPVDSAPFSYYEIRMTRNALETEPEKAPTGRYDGEQVALFPIDQVPTNVNGDPYFVLTGLEEGHSYWFTIWTVSDNPDVRSEPLSMWYQTSVGKPSAPQNFRATQWKEKPDFPFVNFRFEWDNPETTALRMGNYLITVSGTNPQPTISDEVATNGWVPRWGENEVNGYGYSLNSTFYFAIRATNSDGTYGPAAYAVGSSQETRPGPVRNVRTTVNAYNSITLNWDVPLSPGALGWYLIRWDRGGAPGLNSGYLFSRVPSSQTSITFASEGNTTYGFTVWPMTLGLQPGTPGSVVTTTPVGIFNKFWEGEVAWTQSYKQNGQFSSLGSGFSDDLYYGYGDSFNGNQRSMAGWNIPGNVYGAYAVDRVELHFYNKHAWYNTGADCWFGVHSESGKPGTFRQERGGQALYRLPKPGWMHLDVTWWLAQHLKNGAKGITLGPGPNNDKLFYGFAAGVRGPRPVLKVWYRTLGS